MHTCMSKLVRAPVMLLYVELWLTPIAELAAGVDGRISCCQQRLSSRGLLPASAGRCCSHQAAALCLRNQIPGLIPGFHVQPCTVMSCLMPDWSVLGLFRLVPKGLLTWGEWALCEPLRKLDVNACRTTVGDRIRHASTWHHPTCRSNLIADHAYLPRGHKGTDG